MKTYYELREQLLKTHDEIAMKDAKNNEEEDKLDYICERILQAVDGLSELF